LSVDQVIANKPDWVKRQIGRRDAKAIAREVRRAGARTLVEVGVASGYSSAILYAAGRSTGAQPALYAFDLAKCLYYDASRRSGDAFYEILGDAPGYFLNVGLTSAEVSDLPPVDFLFIDACHQHPWPALDLLSLSRYLKEGAIVALHDLELIFQEYSWARQQDGPRDLYRSWIGKKWLGDRAPNVGFLYFEKRAMLESLVPCLSLDWNTIPNESCIRHFLDICELIPGSSLIANVISAKGLVQGTA
jgi:hypothetical protein